jgi:hypothetical protein
MGSSSVGKVQLLVKASGSLSVGPMGLGLNGPPVEFRVRPLFESIGKTDTEGAAPASEWHIVETELPAAGMSQWDLCREMMAHGQSLAPGGIEIVEPVLESRPGATQAFGAEGERSAERANCLGGPGASMTRRSIMNMMVGAAAMAAAAEIHPAEASADIAADAGAQLER